MISGVKILKVSSIRVATWNMAGNSAIKLQGLMDFTTQYQPDVIGIQESMNKRILLPGYTCYVGPSGCSDRGGVTTLIKNTLGIVEETNRMANGNFLYLKELQIKIINYYAAPDIATSLKNRQIELIKKAMNTPTTYLIGDLNEYSKDFKQTFTYTRVFNGAMSAIDIIHSEQMEASKQMAIPSHSDHMILYKDYLLNRELIRNPVFDKNNSDRILDQNKPWFGKEDLTKKIRREKTQTMSKLDPIDEIMTKWNENDTKSAHQKVQNMMEKKKGIITNRIKGCNFQQSVQAVQDFYGEKFAGQTVRPIQNKPLEEPLDPIQTGTVYYKWDKWSKYLPDLLRNISTDKALGPDGISDRWLRQGKNAKPYIDWINDWINGQEVPPPWINDSNFMLLSKKGEVEPNVDDTRPIAMGSALRKIQEAAFMRLFGNDLWDTVHPTQIGFRPQSLMGENTAKLLRIIKEKEYKILWFIDISGAYDSIPQPMLIDEIHRRAQILKSCKGLA